MTPDVLIWFNFFVSLPTEIITVSVEKLLNDTFEFFELLDKQIKPKIQQLVQQTFRSGSTNTASRKSVLGVLTETDESEPVKPEEEKSYKPVLESEKSRQLKKIG